MCLQTLFHLNSINWPQSNHRGYKRKRCVRAFVADDRRGHNVSGNKKPEEDIQFVRKHIEKFPHTPSHYTRASSKREYLDPKLTIKKMFQLYVADLAEKHPEVPVSATVYSRDMNFQCFFEILIFLMLHLMNFCHFITFFKFFLGHAKTSRTQRRFTYDKYH